MDEELRRRLDTLEAKVDAAYTAARKVQSYMFWTGVVTVALVVLPAIGLVFAIPAFLSTYSQIGNI